MYSVLEALYNGEIMPSERCRPSQEEYRHLAREHAQNQQRMLERVARLDPDLAEELTVFLDDYMPVLAMEEAAVFVDAFRLGARIMMEVLAKDPDR